MEKVNLSVIVPVYNEETVIEKNTLLILEYLKQLDIVKDFEILLCDNGSTDSTYKIAKGLASKHKQIKTLHTDKRGLGLAIRMGIKDAKFEYLKKQDIDIPFGLEVFKECLSVKDADAVIDSKGHPDSIIDRPLLRRVYSKILNILMRALYGIKIKDSQGSILFKKADIAKFIDKLNSDTAFLQTQLVIYLNLHKKKIKEIPVKYIKEGKSSGIRPFRDGLRMFFELILERVKILFSKHM